MKVAVYQNNPQFGEIQRNIDEIIKIVAEKEYDLLVLPELAVTGYQFIDRNEAIDLSDKAGEGATFDAFANLANQNACAVVFGYPEKCGGKIFNSAIAVLPDGNYYNYHKTHLFDTEKAIFDPGESGFVTYKFMDVTLGIMICYDWRYPESARKLALDGAQIICHPSNLVLPFCPDAMITRALENRIYTVTANRIGEENRANSPVKFIGKSRIVAPSGDVLADFPVGETALQVVEIDPELATNKQVTQTNDLFKDRRTEFY